MAKPLPLFVILILLLSACTPIALPSATPITPTQTDLPRPTPTSSQPQANLLVETTLLQPLSSGNTIQIELLDEVTGAAGGAAPVQMQPAGKQKYTANLPVPVGSMIKYRYRLSGKTGAIEHTCPGLEVPYRMAWVTGPDRIQDVICHWDETPAKTGTGRVAGKITARPSGKALAGILVEAGGRHTLTANDGSYLIEGLPDGTHRLFVTSLDGAYLPDQQGAMVQQNALTPANFQLAPAKMVNITFQVTASATEIPTLPIRLAGNLYALGYRFAGPSDPGEIAASRAPLLRQEKDTRYAVTIKLPAGFDLRYQYTLGNSKINTELLANGDVRIRQYIVPDRDATVVDKIETWQSADNPPLTFLVTTPADTPATDSIAIQIAPESGSEPLSMWSLGNNRYYFQLFNPPAAGELLNYRYCRNDQCGSADDLAGIRTVKITKENARVLKDTVLQWSLWAGAAKPAKEKLPKEIHTGLFMTGIELQSNYRTSWLPYLNQAFSEIEADQAGWVVLTPGWKYTTINPPVLESVPGVTPLRAEVNAMIQRAQKNHLHVALYPQMDYGEPSPDWWYAARKDSDWWARWYDRYSTFLLNFASLAEQNGVGALIIGDPSLAPTLPVKKPAIDHMPDAKARWQTLIANVREVYHGQILWAISASDDPYIVPPFLDQIDQVYLLWSLPLAKQPGATLEQLTKEFEKQLNAKILPLREKVNKPFLLGVAYPSTAYAATGCVEESAVCASFEALNQPLPANAGSLDANLQANLYRAIFQVIRKSDYQWISGLISRGYNPAVALQDQSLSVRGKPAEAVLRAWFEQFTANP